MKTYNCVAEAYLVLEKIHNSKEEVTVEEAMIAIEEALGYLGEVLDG